MKFFLTMMTCFLATILFAQPTGNIEIDTVKANEYYEQSLTLDECSEERIIPIEKALELYTEHNLIEKIIQLKGWLAFNLSCYDEERLVKEANEAIALAKEKLGNEKHISTHEAYLALVIYEMYYDMDKALEYAYLILDNPKISDMNYFETVNYLVYTYRTISKEYKVEPYLLAYEQRLEKNKNPYLKKYEITLNEVRSIIYGGLENYEKSILYGKETLRLNEQYDQPFNMCMRYADISEAYANLNKISLAQEYLNLFIQKTDTIGFNTNDYYNFYGMIAIQYSEIGNGEKAIYYAIRAKDILLPEAHDFPEIMAQAYDNLSYHYHRLGKYKEAKEASENSFQYLVDPLSIIHYLNVLYQLGEVEKGLEYAQKGLQLLDENFKPVSIFDNPQSNTTDNSQIDAIYLLGHKAHFLYQKSKTVNNKIELLNAAKKTVILAIELQQRHFLNYKGFDVYIDCLLCGNEDNLIVYQKAIYDITRETKDLEEVFNYVEQFKGKALLEHFTDNPLPEDLAITENLVNKNINYYKQKIELTTADSLTFFEKKLFDENQKMEKFVALISKNHPEHANYFYNTNYAAAKDVQTDIDEQTAFISYVITEKHLITYVITKDKQASFQIEIGDDFHGNISKFALLLGNPFLVQTSKRNQFIELGNTLYQQLFQLIEAYIEDKTKLIISPNGNLFYLPFEVLLATNDQKPFHELDFLIKQFEISYQYSATTYQRLQAQPAIRNQSFIGFAPIFKNGLVLDEQTRALPFLVDSLYQSIDNNHLSALPNTKIEVTTISNLLPSTVTKKVLIGKAATKNSILQFMNTKVQFLHIATHGLVNYENPNLSALACYNSSNYQGNFLFANEIQNATIKADLVILSSCESGIGRQILGEGLIALNRSFIIGGANNVIFSLWKVNDEYSSKLMIDFYKFYLNNTSYTKALRQAKLKMLQNPITASPRYWAAFVLIGE